MERATEILVWGTLIHLVGDWVLQNDWMVHNKVDLRHPAGWVHGAIHVLGLLLVMPAAAALAVGLVHVLIDTRRPVLWWLRVFKKSGEGATGLVIQIWLDQTLHLLVLGIAALSLGALGA